jgi:phage tail sheath protein FI
MAVANQPLKDVVALNLATSTDERQALLEAQINAVIASPSGFVLSTSETLLDDADWRPVNVRRLMNLLRRLALRRGATYVFEPNGNELRRTVERAFEAMLGELLRRGAFAGASAAQSFRVELGDDVNTASRRDAGQFHVDLKVAPALPLTFLTVRLARSGERLSARELR